MKPEDFQMQIRDPEKARTRVNENGEEETMAKREPINKKKVGAVNLFTDDGEEKDKYDKSGVLYKGVKKAVRRQETALKKIVKTCNRCNKEFETVSPQYVCDNCIVGRK